MGKLDQRQVSEIRSTTQNCRRVPTVGADKWVRFLRPGHSSAIEIIYVECFKPITLFAANLPRIISNASCLAHLTATWSDLPLRCVVSFSGIDVSHT